MPIDKSNLNLNENKESSKKESKPKLEFFISDPLFKKDDLVLPNEKKTDIDKAINLYKFQNEIYIDWGLGDIFKHSKKVIINLHGKPGTGKTMAAHAIADELNKKLLIINYADIESKYVGETPKNIHSAFEQAKTSDSIIFFDEADAILSRRVTNMSNATDTSVNQTRSVLLNILNDYDGMVIFATNFIGNYDPAFIRRILLNIELTLPDLDNRKSIYKKYIPSKMPNDINIEEVSLYSEGLSPADIANSILISAFSAKTNNLNLVSTKDVISAIDSIKSAINKNKIGSFNNEKSTLTEVKTRN